jgi:hypothetical protein
MTSPPRTCSHLQLEGAEPSGLAPMCGPKKHATITPRTFRGTAFFDLFVPVGHADGHKSIEAPPHNTKKKQAWARQSPARATTRRSGRNPPLASSRVAALTSPRRAMRSGLREGAACPCCVNPIRPLDSLSGLAPPLCARSRRAAATRTTPTGATATRTAMARASTAPAAAGGFTTAEAPATRATTPPQTAETAATTRALRLRPLVIARLEHGSIEDSCATTSICGCALAILWPRHLSRFQ